ncbi:hypothetical protein [Hyphomicrobium sp. NDB2Meth4]|uniref:hypothetical protein n=1 Tax=Hyphomicrobium sp. NDB2Meth4 TaxID=1892846 RepID=UPI000B0E7DEF|nr:hypothetical protein [Hyphomicrobium sp. NDB2Meth4]
MATKDMAPVRLPPDAVALMDELIGGLYGTSRGEVARTLILDELKRLFADRITKK